LIAFFAEDLLNRPNGSPARGFWQLGARTRSGKVEMEVGHVLTTQEKIPATRPPVVPDEPDEHLSHRSPPRRRVTPPLAAGAALVGLVNAGVFLILDGFAVERGLGLAVEVSVGILAFVTALVLSEAQHRRHSRWTPR
jgi:hypothetical protein